MTPDRKINLFVKSVHLLEHFRTSLWGPDLNMACRLPATAQMAGPVGQTEAGQPRPARHGRNWPGRV